MQIERAFVIFSAALFCILIKRAEVVSAPSTDDEIGALSEQDIDYAEREMESENAESADSSLDALLSDEREDARRFSRPFGTLESLQSFADGMKVGETSVESNGEVVEIDGDGESVASAGRQRRIVTRFAGVESRVTESGLMNGAVKGVDERQVSGNFNLFRGGST